MKSPMIQLAVVLMIVGAYGCGKESSLSVPGAEQPQASAADWSTSGSHQSSDLAAYQSDMGQHLTNLAVLGVKMDPRKEAMKEDARMTKNVLRLDMDFYKDTHKSKNRDEYIRAVSQINNEINATYVTLGKLKNKYGKFPYWYTGSDGKSVEVKDLQSAPKEIYDLLVDMQLRGEDLVRIAQYTTNSIAKMDAKNAKKPVGKK